LTPYSKAAHDASESQAAAHSDVLTSRKTLSVGPSAMHTKCKVW